MSRHLPYSKDTIAAARAVNLVEYLRSRGVEIEECGHVYCRLKTHDSLVIHRVTNEWWWNSQSLKGYNAVDFLMTYYKYSFLEAVGELIGSRPYADRRLSYTAPPQKPAVELPPPASTMHRVYAYLTKTRFLDAAVVTMAVKRKMLYEDMHHNAVFVGYNKDRPAYAFARGTLSDYVYKCDQSYSDKRYGFRFEGMSDTLYVFEAAIDLLSYLCLHPDPTLHHSYAALGGLSPLTAFGVLQRSSHIRRVVLCLDNDVPGIWAAAKLHKRLSPRYEVEITYPEQKDWNIALKVQKTGEESPKDASFRYGQSRILRVFDAPEAFLRYALTDPSDDNFLLIGTDREKETTAFLEAYRQKNGYDIQSIIQVGGENVG